MEFVDSLERGFQYVVRAGESGRQSLAAISEPLDGAVREITGAAADLADLPGLPPELAGRVQRLTRGLGAAQSQLGGIISTYDRASRAAMEIDERFGVLGGQIDRVSSAVGSALGSVSPGAASILTGRPSPADQTPAPEAVGGYPHLLVMQPLDPSISPFYFNLDTAAFDALRRTSQYRWAAQERLTRRAAMQSVGIGEDRLTISGAIFPAYRGGLGQVEALREIAARQYPVTLTTGYGVVLGAWCVVRIEEEQAALIAGGAPRQQKFTVEFMRYGDDLQNV